MIRRRRISVGGDRGATAVEFALLLPMLLLIIFGVIDFGRALNAQITLTQAAREGVRLDALGQPQSAVVSRTIQAATGLNLTSSNVTETLTCPLNAGPTADARVDVTYRFSFVTPVGAIAGLFGGNFGGPITLTAQGVMPCET
ncbi:MAG: pilus assembly protein [Actinomycetota bacterium]|nr:pilus assembly protein [Actinomycetota bacterium]